MCPLNEGGEGWTYPLCDSDGGGRGGRPIPCVTSRAFMMGGPLSPDGIQMEGDSKLIPCGNTMPCVIQMEGDARRSSFDNIVGEEIIALHCVI